MGILNPLYAAVTWVIVNIHAGLSTVLDPNSGAAWALSIVLLTVCIRIVLFPLFVKQIKSSRKMQELQPKIQELRRKYKNDKQRQQQETMKLWQENNANPLGGCLPMLVQLPVFIALFRVLNTIAQKKTTSWGLTEAVVTSASQAHLLGAGIADRFLNSRMAPGSGTDQLFAISGSSTSAKIVALVLVLVSSTTMFLTMRHSMRNSTMQQATSGDDMAAKQQQMQKMLLFMAPLLGLFTLWLPIGVLLYIVTNNVWTLTQNFYIYRKYPVAAAAGAGDTTADTAAQPLASANGSGGGLKKRLQRAAAAKQETKPEASSTSPQQQVVRRQQPSNKPRSKRSGSRKR